MHKFITSFNFDNVCMYMTVKTTKFNFDRKKKGKKGCLVSYLVSQYCLIVICFEFRSRAVN